MTKNNRLWHWRKSHLLQKLICSSMLMRQIILVSILLFSFDAFAQKGNKINNITIFAEDGMAYPLVKIVRLYSRDNNSTVSTNFNNSFESIKNIEDGEPVDVFIASHPDWIELLKQKGLVDVYSISNIAKDRLVLVTSFKNQKIDFNKISQLSDIKSILTDINHRQIPIIADSPDSSLGKYAKDLLKDLDFDNKNIYYKLAEDRTSIVDFIEQNTEYCGLTLASALKNYSDIKVLKAIDDRDIYYQALVIAGSNMNQARDFVSFFKSEAAKDIFVENGFSVE